MLATAAFAQTADKPSPLSRQSFKMQKESSAKTNLRAIDMLPAEARPAKAGAAASDAIITETPAGEHKIYERKGYAYYFSPLYGLSLAYIKGYVSDVVYADDGKTVYWKNPIGQINTGSWLKGEKTSENTIKFTLPQPIYEASNETLTKTYYAYRLVLNGNSYVTDENPSYVELTIKGDSLIQAGPDDGSYILGMADADGAWTGYGDYCTRLGVVTDKPNTPPDEPALSEYSIKYTDIDGVSRTAFLKGQVSGSDIYLTGLPKQAEGTYIKGTFSDGKAVFKDRQYLGIDRNFGIHSYLRTAYKTEATDPTTGEPYTGIGLEGKDLIFDYDATTGKLSTDQSFVLNSGADEAYYVEFFEAPVLAPFKDVAATPKDPEFTSFSHVDPSYELGWAMFNLYAEDVDGNALNTGKLYYNIYHDGEKFTFTPEVYLGLDEDITDIPYDFTDEYDLYIDGTSRIIYFYETGFEKFGVQLVYTGGGETHKSNIVYNDGSTVTTGISNVTDDTKAHGKVVSTVYTDVSGRRTSKPAKGIYIKSERLEDGSVRTSKVIVK